MMSKRLANWLWSIGFVLLLVDSTAISKVQQSQVKPIVLFDDAVCIRGLEQLVAIGAKRYLIVYQDDVDSEIKNSGRIQSEQLIAKIGKSVTPESEGWGVLDFEFPFEDWIQRPIDTVEHQTAEREMIKAIKAVKAAYPKMKWTYWGIPNLPFYVDGRTWNSMPKTRVQELVSERLVLYANVLSECDWLSPCVYVTIGDEALGGVPSVSQRDAIRAWTFARVSMAVGFYRASNLNRPVLPFVSPLYMPGGGARSLGVVPLEAVKTDTLEPARAAGAQGVAIWTAASFFLRQAFAKQGSLEEFGGSATVLRRWREDLKNKSECEPLELRAAVEELLSNAVTVCANSVHDVWSQTGVKSVE